jgi:peptidoglycan/LPS O-acetylase OafA/YrhL
MLVLILQTYLTSFPNAFNVVDCCRPFLLAIIFFGTIEGIGPLVSVVSLEWIRRVGLVSYSLYLWQQLSTGHPSYHNDNALLLVPIAFVVPALISYFLIERPGIKLGHKLSAKVQSTLGPSVPLTPATSQPGRRRGHRRRV